MSKPRHQPRVPASPSKATGAGDVKLRLRLPTDGSVDLDKLRAALEAQLEKNRQPVAEEIPVVEPEPVTVQPEPQLKPERAPSATWAWIKARPFFTTALASALLAFVMGIVLIAQKAGGGATSGTVGWLFVLGLGTLIVSFGFVFKRERKSTPEVATVTTFLDWIKQHKKIVIGTGLGMATLVVLGLWIAAIVQSQSAKPKPDEIAKGPTTPKIITPTPPVTPKPPVTPPAETADTFKPADGFTGRLMVVFSIGCALGLGGLQMRRVEDSFFPTPEAKAAAAKIGYIDFWHGFRHFLAAQGGFVLVALATGAVMLIGNSVNIETLKASMLWAFAGIGLAAALVMALGAAGVNLMPALDRTVHSSTTNSAAARFALRKIWHVILMGLIFGAVVSVSLVEPIREWWHLWLKWSLSIGMVVAFFWNGAKLIPKEKDIKPLPRTRPGQFRALPFYNVPLLTAATLLAAAGVMHLWQIHWLHLWWIAPLTGLGVTVALAALRSLPRLLRHWVEILFFPAVVAIICDVFVWRGNFWLVLGALAGLFALGNCLTENRKTVSGWLLITPSSRRKFQPVLNPEKSGLQVRWGSLIIILAAAFLLIGTAAKWAWSGSPADAPEDVPTMSAS